MIDQLTAAAPPTPRATPWKDAVLGLFGPTDMHYTLNDASMADLLLASISTHTSLEDTIPDALDHLAAELYMVINGIENAPDTSPEITCAALGGIERRIRVLRTIAVRLQRLVDHAEVTT